MVSSLGLLMALIAGGGSNELLDYVQTNAYWQGRQTPVTVAAMTEQLAAPDAARIAALIADLSGQDAAKREAASGQLQALGEAALPELQKIAPGKTPDEKDLRITELIGQIGQRRRVQAVRRLMAIRTLGELKDPAAAGALRGLLASKAPFEAQYAQEALAALEGKACVRPGAAAKTFAGDIWMLPAGCGAVVQMKMPPGGPVDYAKALAGMPGMGPEAVGQVTKMILEAAERVGNVRIDGGTIGLSADLGEDEKGKDRGWVAVVVRGRYDGEAVRGMLGSMGPRGKSEAVDGVPVLWPDREFAMVFLSDEQLAIVGGPRDVDKTPLIKGLIAAARTGKGSLVPDSPVGKLIGTLDVSRPAWGAVVVNDNYRKAAWLAPFDTVTVSLDPARQADNVTFSARGSDAQKVAETVAQVQTDIARAKESIAREMAREEARSPLQPMADVVNSIQVKADGASATMTGTLKGNGVAIMAPLWMFGRVSAAEAARAEAMPAPQPVQPAPRK